MSKVRWGAFWNTLAVLLFLSSAAYPSLDVSPAEKALAGHPIESGKSFPINHPCKSDADCTVLLTDECDKWTCGTLNGDGNGQCQQTPVYPLGSGEYECCKAGVSSAGKDWACCVKHDDSLCDDKNPCTDDKCLVVYTDDTNPAEKGVGKCSNTPIPGKECGPETCPTCPKCDPPKIDCSLLGDPKLRDCCTVKGGLLWLVMNSCVDHGSGGTADCSNIAKHVTNSGNFQQCCLINNGIINGDINMCNNNWTTGGGPSPTGGTTTGGTTTSAALGTCQVQCKDADCNIAVDKAGNAVGWLVSYSAPSSVGAVASVALKQSEGDPLTAENPASTGGALSIKTITDPSNLPPFVVYTQKPTSMMGAYLPKFKVAVELDDVSGSALATYTCGNETALEAKGSGGCGCLLGAGSKELGANLLLLSFFALPFVFQRKRRRS